MSRAGPVMVPLRVRCRPGALVEVVDVVVAFGEHEDVVAGEGGGVPVGGHVVADVDRGVGDEDAVVGVVAVERVGDPAGAQVGEGVAFPGVLLAAVLGEGDGREPVGEPVEETAGVDGVELAGIADHDDLRAGVVCGVEEGDEAAGGCHRGFVDDEHGLSVEAEGAVGELEGAERDGVGRDAGLGLELRGGGRGERGTDDVVAAVAPRVGGGVEGERLAGPRRGDDDIDPVAGGGDRGDRGDLFGREFRPGVERPRRCGSATTPAPVSIASSARSTRRCSSAMSSPVEYFG